jgi:hypothetical protein
MNLDKIPYANSGWKLAGQYINSYGTRTYLYKKIVTATYTEKPKNNKQKGEKKC